VRHGGQAVLVVRRPAQFQVGRVIGNPVDAVTGLVELLQHRRVLVCDVGKLGQTAGGISAQSVASVPPAPADMDTMAGRSSYSPLKRSAVRRRSKSVLNAECSASMSAAIAGSPVASSLSSTRSSARRWTSCQSASSVRSASASRITRWACCGSSHRSGWAAWSSNPLRRSVLPPRSKPPRGRVDPAGEIADGGGFHQLLARTSWSRIGRSSMIFNAVLLRATTGLTQGQ